MNHNDNILDDYFEEVGRDSADHKKDIEKFSQLLDNLLGSYIPDKDDRYKNELASFKNTVHDFEKYIERNKVYLAKQERNSLSLISESAYSSIVKKRMAEDLIHKIKKRHEEEKSKNQVKALIDKEIDEIRNSKTGIAAWYRITKFSINYGTLTVFSHKIRDSSLSIIRNKVLSWQKTIEKAVKNSLDNKYYMLSTIEYNALEIILQLKKPIDDICSINISFYYDDRLISDKIDNFAKIYITLLKNSRYTEFAFNKVIKEKDSKEKNNNHGLYGILKNLLDQPIHNNKPLLRNEYDKIKNSITGFLFSYYTSREKVIIRTINQILYLLAFDGKLNYDQKHLTEEALLKSKISQESIKVDDSIPDKKLEELNRVFEIYLPKGLHLEERIVRVDYGNQYMAFINNVKNKPVMRILKLFEGNYYYFIDYIIDKNNFIVMYDENEFNGYFDIKPEIYDTADKYNACLTELSGTKKKEIEGLVPELNGTVEGLINSLTSPESSRLTDNPKIKFATSVLQKISEINYRIASSLHEMISSYYNNREVINEDKKKNFDFFLNSIVKRSKNQRLNKFFNKDDISLKEFLESACSLCFHIAHSLNNVSIGNMVKERNQLKSSMTKIEISQPGLIHEQSINADIEENSVIEKIDTMYKDSLTKLWKIDYFKDQVVPKLYNEKNNYKLNIPRFVFMSNIIGFEELNNKYGHNNVDDYFSKFSYEVQKHVDTKNNVDNLVFRYGAGQLLGYLNDITLLEAVDILMRVNSSIQNIVSSDENVAFDKIIYNFAVYEERLDTNHFQNTVYVTKMLSILNSGPGKRVGFLKNPKHEISGKDFDSRGNLSSDLFTQM